MAIKVIPRQRRKELYLLWAKKYLSGDYYHPERNEFAGSDQGICWRLRRTSGVKASGESWGHKAIAYFPEMELMAWDREYWWMHEYDDDLRATILLFCHHMIK